MIVKTEKLTIRNFREKDAAGSLECRSHRRADCFMDERLCFEEATLAYMFGTPKNMLSHSVCVKEGDFVIGDVFALQENADVCGADRQFIQRFEGEGEVYGTATGRSEYLSRDAGARRIYGFAADGNRRSKRLCACLGGRHEGCMKEFISFVCHSDGEPRYEDTCIYAILNK